VEFDPPTYRCRVGKRDFLELGGWNRYADQPNVGHGQYVVLKITEEFGDDVLPLNGKEWITPYAYHRDVEAVETPFTFGPVIESISVGPEFGKGGEQVVIEGFGFFCLADQLEVGG
jgi:hypothetical protein